MAWPSRQDYREALQACDVAFSDPELKSATAVCDNLGMPRAFSEGGRYALDMLLFLRLALMATLMLSSCNDLRMATADADKTVRIETAPSGSMVTIDGFLVGTSPCDCVLPRRRQIVVEVEPPKDTSEKLWPQRRTFDWVRVPATGAVVYFDLRGTAAAVSQPGNSAIVFGAPPATGIR